MSTGSRRQSSPHEDLGPVLTGALLLLCFLVAFPAWLIGYLAQRAILRTSLHWKLRLLLLLVPAFLVGYYFYTHSIISLITQETDAWVRAATQYQLDLAHWPWGMLWSITWPVWLHTIIAIPIAAFAQELITETTPGQTLHQLRRQERRQQQAIARSQQKAKKRSARPGRLPNRVAGSMMIGTIIDDEKEAP